MFYDQLLHLCEINNEKMTPLVKKLNLSTGNIKRWKEGTLPSSDIVVKIAEYFGVSVDYLLNTEKKITFEKQSSDDKRQKLINKILKMDEKNFSFVEEYVDFIIQRQKNDVL